MAPATYQTIKLSKGKHRSPEEGACVMELASMLAREPFSDHPVSVCPVIGSFLRAYNDSVDSGRRQDLYAFAAKVVGSRGSAELQRVRAQRLDDWVAELRRRRWTRFLAPEWLRRLGPKPSMDLAGTRAVQAIIRHRDCSHQEVLAVIDELLALSVADRELPSTAGRGHESIAMDASASRQLQDRIHAHS